MKSLNIFEYGELFCKGIVFSMENINRKSPTRFDNIRDCQTPEEMAAALNANGRRFRPKEYTKNNPNATPRA